MAMSLGQAQQILLSQEILVIRKEKKKARKQDRQIGDVASTSLCVSNIWKQIFAFEGAK